MNALEEARKTIDRVDADIAALFEERMHAAAVIGRYKIENRLPVFDAAREAEVIDKNISRLRDASLAPYYREFLQATMGVSRRMQADLFPKAGKRFLVLNGPNLNLLGVREPEHYGLQTYASLCEELVAFGHENGFDVTVFQSNHEGELVEQIQQAKGVFDGIVINPAAYTHTSVALLDALKAVSLPAVEVHISKVEEREPFRQISYVRAACVKTVIGHGTNGYKEALAYLNETVK